MDGPSHPSIQRVYEGVFSYKFIFRFPYNGFVENNSVDPLNRCSVSNRISRIHAISFPTFCIGTNLEIDTLN